MRGTTAPPNGPSSSSMSGARCSDPCTGSTASLARSCPTPHSRRDRTHLEFHLSVSGANRSNGLRCSGPSNDNRQFLTRNPQPAANSKRILWPETRLNGDHHPSPLEPRVQCLLYLRDAALADASNPPSWNFDMAPGEGSSQSRRRQPSLDAITAGSRPSGYAKGDVGILGCDPRACPRCP